MTDELYNAAWAAIDDLMSEYMSLTGRFTVPDPPTQADLNRVHAEYVIIRDSELAPLGVTMDELEIDCVRRLG
jgi:hypothetical protein